MPAALGCIASTRLRAVLQLPLFCRSAVLCTVASVLLTLCTQDLPIVGAGGAEMRERRNVSLPMPSGVDRNELLIPSCQGHLPYCAACCHAAASSAEPTLTLRLPRLLRPGMLVDGLLLVHWHLPGHPLDALPLLLLWLLWRLPIPGTPRLLLLLFRDSALLLLLLLLPSLPLCECIHGSPHGLLWLRQQRQHLLAFGAAIVIIDAGDDAQRRQPADKLAQLAEAGVFAGRPQWW